ncbi:unnamed protein product, partial [Allacma fusca]
HSLRLKNDLMRLAASEVENLNAYAKPGRKIFDRVTKIIKNRTTYKISRQTIAGSMGKKTSLGYDLEPDFDVVLFIYDKISSLKPVVDQFYDILLNNLPLQCRSSIIELVAIQAALEGGTNILEAFRRFLQLIKDVDNIYINFFDSVTRPRPLILDAVNPFNNYAKPIKPIHKAYFHQSLKKH